MLRDFTTTIRVPIAWGDMDAFSHVNNTVYLRYFESARMAYFYEFGFMKKRDKAKVGPILASVSCRFKAPLHYPDEVEVGARVCKWGEDRFTMEHAIYSKNLDRIVAVGEGTIVAYDYERQAKTRVPDAWLEAVKR